jgi:hypothetical protein
MIQIPVEIASKLATTFRGTPALLALLLINTLFMAMVVWALWVSADLRFKERAEMMRVIERCTMNAPRS